MRWRRATTWSASATPSSTSSPAATTPFCPSTTSPRASCASSPPSEAGRLYEAMGPAIERSGGSAANTIAGLASFGAKCGFIGRVAADQFGGIFRHDIRSLGVAYDTPPADDGAPTARCLILVTPDGERTMNTFLGASVDFTAADIDAATDRGGEDRLSRRLSVRPDRGQGRLQARRRGSPGDPAPRSPSALSDAFCVDRHRDDFRALIARRRRHRLRQ